MIVALHLHQLRQISKSIRDNIDTINKNTKNLIDATEEVNIEETKHMLLSCHQNAVKIWTKIANRAFENVSLFKYLGTIVTYQNLIQEEIKRRLNSGIAYYHSIQNLLS
jgi:hypothetical protein